MKYAQLVIGPAGSGKSTYCTQLQQHCETVGRTVHCVNLDPAAENFGYPVSIDVRDLITLEDVMEEMKLGPNGGLLYCMEYLEDNLQDWLSEELEGYGEDDYLVFDCPGQIELYSHVPVFRTLVNFLQRNGWRVCTIYVLDSHFITDSSKFIAGCMQALSAMVLLETPHINVLTKMDICPLREELVDKFLIPDGRQLAEELTDAMGERFRRLNVSVGNLLDDFSMVSYVPLDVTDEESIAGILLQIDMALQYGEEEEVRSKDFEGRGPDDLGGDDDVEWEEGDED